MGKIARANGHDIDEAVQHILGVSPMRQKVEEIREALVKASAAVLDAHAERDHWRLAYAEVSSEMRLVIAMLLKQTGRDRLVITEREYAAFDPALEVFAGNPEPGVRVYELRRRATGPEAANGPAG
jgi:hypothetical protein